MALPASGYISDPLRTQGEQKTALEDQRDAVAATEWSSVFGGVSTGVPNAYDITVLSGPSAYALGMEFRFQSHQANTGAVTLNVSGVAAIAIKNLAGGDLVTGDILSSDRVHVYHDGTFFVLLPATSALKFKTGQFTRNTADANGNQGVTGVGFKPKSMIVWGGQSGVAGYASFGFANLLADQRVMVDIHTTIASAYDFDNTKTIFTKQSAASFVTGELQQFDADGFTLAWVKGGSPAGINTYHFLAFG